MRVLSDEEIADLIGEQKPCPEDWREQLTPRRVAGRQHAVGGFPVEGTGGRRFSVLSRMQPAEPRNFSIILRFDDTDGASYRLLRCNGPHQRHTNTIERELGRQPAQFARACHIHYATERYQLRGFEIDSYAEPTGSFYDFWSAVEQMLRMGNLVVPPTAQGTFQSLLEDERQ